MSLAVCLSMNPLPYDILIDPSGVWYGPAGTDPKSRDWQTWNGPLYEFFCIICRPEFILDVTSWRVRAREI